MCPAFRALKDIEVPIDVGIGANLCKKTPVLSISHEVAWSLITLGWMSSASSTSTSPIRTCFFVTGMVVTFLWIASWKPDGRALSKLYIFTFQTLIASCRLTDDGSICHLQHELCHQGAFLGQLDRCTSQVISVCLLRLLLGHQFCSFIYLSLCDYSEHTLSHYQSFLQDLTQGWCRCWDLMSCMSYVSPASVCSQWSQFCHGHISWKLAHPSWTAQTIFIISSKATCQSTNTVLR